MHDPHVCSPGEQVRREGMPEGVGRDGESQVGAVRGGSDDEPRILSGDTVTPHTEKKCGRGIPPRSQQRTHPDQIRIDRVTRITAQRHDALLRALAEEAHDVVVDNVVDVEGDRLGDTGTGRVEQLEEGFVTQRLR